MSLASMASGQRALFLRAVVQSAVSVTAYPFLQVLHGIESGLDYATGLVISYDSTHEENRHLRGQLSEVMRRAAQRSELLAENERLRRMIAFTRSRPGFTLQPVDILENSKGTVMIDRGSLHGLHEAMCAVTEEGVVGRITEVTPVTATLVTLHSAHFAVGAMIERNRVRGIVHGTGGGITRYCTMNYIDMKDDVQENDWVVTSPESGFPAGYPIGRVVRCDYDTGALWKTAEVAPVVDPYTLDEIFVLRQATPPADILAGQTHSEIATLPTVSAAPVVPDTRSLQERYAP